MNSPTTKIKAGIYRLQMFKPSEPFIAEQIAALPSAQRTLIGRNLLGKPDARFNHVACESLGKFPNLELAALGYSGALKKEIEKLKLDVLHAHFAVDGLSALSFADRLKLPLVTTLHGFDVTTKPAEFLKSRKPALVRYALGRHRLAARGELFLAVSDFIANRAIEAGFPQDKIVRHYIGIDTSRFNPDAALRDPSRKRLLHVARLVEKKGTKYLLEAFSRVEAKHPDAVLDIVGDGPLQASLQQQAATLGISGKVHFHGAVPHQRITELMLSSHLFVLPSITAQNGDSEGLPIVILEAAACGLPVVSTYHAGIPEAVIPDQTGFLTAEHDMPALAEALDALLSQDALCDQFGKAARATACERFDIRRQSAILESLYAGLRP